jgi:hypothetical protein
LQFKVFHPIQDKGFDSRFTVESVPIFEGFYCWEMVLRRGRPFLDVSKDSGISYLEGGHMTGLSLI